MKALFLSAFSLVALPLLAQTSTTTSGASTTSTTTTTTPAQAPPAASGASMISQAMSTLTPAEQDQLKSAQQKALLDNPNLQTEAMDLMQKNMALQTGTASDADREALRTQTMAYIAKLHDAMVKADPTIEPILQKIEAEVARLSAESSLSH